MKKLNKIALSLSSLAAVAAPMAAVVSCGSDSGGFNGRFDTSDDGKVILSTTFSSTGPQMRALQEVVDKYNEVKAGEDGFIKITLRSVAGGYGDIANQTATKFEAGDHETLPNMFIDYASGLALMAKYDMGIHMEKLGLNETNIDAHALEVNNNIGGFGVHDRGSVPLGVSSQIMGMNIPLMAYLMKTIGFDLGTPAAGSTLEKIKNYDITVGGANAKDIATIKHLWTNTPSAAQITAAKTAVGTITADTFNSYEKIFDLGGAIMKAFGVNAQDTNNLHFLGVDSPTTLVQNITRSLAQETKYDDIVAKDASDGNYVKNNWYKAGKAQDNMKKALELITGAINSGALWTEGGGSYSSNHSKLHKMAMTIGSSAGYDYNYVPDGTYKDVEDDIIVDQIIDEGGTLKFGHYKNSILPSTSTVAADALGYNVKVKNSADDSKLVAGAFVYFPRAAYKDKPADPIPTNGEAITFIGKSGEKTGYVWAANDAKVAAAGVENLNKSEFALKDPIATSALDGGTKTVFEQGPGIVGIHANDKEDKAVVNFINWFYGSETATFGTETALPSIYFTKQSGYIVPIKDYKKDGTQNNGLIKTAIQGKAGLEAALSALSEISASGGAVTSTLPVDYTSAPFRKKLDAAIKAGKDKAHVTGTASAETIYNDFKSDIFWRKNIA